jgi:putative membrane protein insertion efficiency factor
MQRGSALTQGLSWLGRLPQRSLIVLVRAYRLLLKPWLGNACRFEPTCSAYALEALQAHGAVRGSLLSGWRLMRCHPWCQGGLDPVPPPPGTANGLFTRLLPGRPPGPPTAP